MSNIYLPTSLTDCYTLANGVKIPAIGYGTWQTPNDVTAACVKMALDLGYRHVDTAWGYDNEVGVGDGIRASGVKREDIFVTTKHWVIFRGYQKTIEAVDDSLKRLGLDYIDLYLVHWPCVELSNPQWQEINAETWRGFEAMYKAGKLRAIGVSNYEEKQIEALAKTAEVMPMVNQLEFHPGYMQLDNIRYNQSKGILVEAWSPLGSGAVLKGRNPRKDRREVQQVRCSALHPSLPRLRHPPAPEVHEPRPHCPERRCLRFHDFRRRPRPHRIHAPARLQRLHPRRSSC